MIVGSVRRSARRLTYWSRGVCRSRTRQLCSSAGLICVVYCVYMSYTVKLDGSSRRLPWPSNINNGLKGPVYEKDSGSSLSARSFTKPPPGEMSGLERASYLRAACQELKAIQPVNFRLYIGSRLRVSYNKDHDALFCPMCKMASSFWTRLFQMMRRNRDNATAANTPFDIPLRQAPPTNLTYDVIRRIVTPSHDAASSFKFMFVRSPYSKLFSAYVDKLLGPNPSMWAMLGKDAIKHARGKISSVCSSDVTFEEYVSYAVHMLERKRKFVDCHYNKFTECSPCVANYTFVGKMESFKADTFEILTKLKQTNTLDVFNTHFSDLHAADAIDDSVSSPFLWRKEITKCISWPDALRRVWRKLQIRGILDTTKFPLADKEANAISKEEFINLVTKVRKTSSSVEKQTIKREAFIEAYNTVSGDTLRKMTTVYSEEMLLFAYDSLDLDTIQNQAEQNTYKGYTDYLGDITVV